MGYEVARAFMLWLVGHVFFDNSSSVVHRGWLIAFADLEAAANYDWGSVIMGRLYKELDEASLNDLDFCGFYLVLEVCAMSLVFTTIYIFYLQSLFL